MVWAYRNCQNLGPFFYNPNAPDRYGWTPIYWAAQNGHTEIVKILSSLTDNPNAPDNNGRTPSSVTKNVEILRILNSTTSKKRNTSMLSGKPFTKLAKKF